MSYVPAEDGLDVVGEPAPDEDPDGSPADTDDDVPEADDDGLELDGSNSDFEVVALRDGFVDAFNARDLDSLLGLVADDVECPDAHGDGPDVLAEELESIWERSPGALLTAGTLDGHPCAVAWLPDEEGCWSRAAVVCFDAGDGQLTVVAVPEDADALDRTHCEEPVGDELDEWVDWAEWDRGEETRPWPRRAGRPPR